MWLISSLKTKINRLFPPPEKVVSQKELENGPKVGTGNKDGDLGFKKIGIKNTLLMFLVTAVFVYLLTMFISGVFGSKKTVKPDDTMQASKAIAMKQNPASNLPDNYSGVGQYGTQGTQNPPATKGADQGIRQGQGGNGSSNAQYQPSVVYQPPPIIDSGYRGLSAGVPNYDSNVQGSSDQVVAKEKNNWVKSAIRFLAVSTAAVNQKDRDREALNLQSSAEKTNSYQMATSNTILAGSVIPVSLLNGINSDLSGDVIAQVRQDVYDSKNGQTLLIPQGARLLGFYEGKTSNGQSRLGIVFTRILFPDGHSITIDRQKGTDNAGYPGLTDKVDNHTGRLIGVGVMTSFLAAAAQVAAGNTNATNHESYGELAVQGAATNVMQAGAKLLERDMQLGPTITIRPGTQFTVFLNKDLVIPAYEGDENENVR